MVSFGSKWGWMAVASSGSRLCLTVDGPGVDGGWSGEEGGLVRAVGGSGVRAIETTALQWGLGRWVALG